jgi:DNA-binding CsgD family transcriptional regulator
MGAKRGIPTLTRWGVSPQADLMFRALTTFGPKSAAELARSLQLPERQVRAALDELHGLDAADVVCDAPSANARVWEGSPPESVAEGLRQRQAQLAAARRRLERRLSILDIVHGPVDLRTARPICGIAGVRARLAELVAAEREEHLAMNPEPAFSATSARAAAPPSRAALRRGVTVRTLGVPASEEDRSEAYAPEMFGYGLQYREMPQQPIKLMVMDRTTAFLPLDPAADFRGGVWEVADQSTVDEVVAFFVRQWSLAGPPADRGWVPPAGLSARERAILAVLSSGATDATAAAKLNLSVRTVAYAVQNLMERYGVRSRFQLGLVLGLGTNATETPSSRGENT